MATKPVIYSILTLVLVGVGATVQAQQSRTQSPTIFDRIDEFGRNLFGDILPSEPSPKPTTTQQNPARRSTQPVTRPRNVPSAVADESAEEPVRAGSVSRAPTRNRFAISPESTTEAAPSRSASSRSEPSPTRSAYSRDYPTVSAPTTRSPSSGSTSVESYRTWPGRSNSISDDTMDYSTESVRPRQPYSPPKTGSVSAGLERPQSLHERMSAARSSAFSSPEPRPSSTASSRTAPLLPEDTVPPSHVLKPVDRSQSASAPAPVVKEDLEPVVSASNAPRSLAREPSPTPVTAARSEPMPVVNKPVAVVKEPVAVVKEPVAVVKEPVKPVVPSEPVVESPAETTPSSTSGDVLLSRRDPNLSVETVGPRRIAVGKESTYEITMVNAGEVPAEELLVTLDLPAWAEVSGAEPSVGTTETAATGASGRQFQWKLARLNAQSRERLSVRIVPRQSKPFDLAIKWTYRQSATQAMIEVQEPKLTLSLEGPREVLFGKKEIYRLRVANIGNGDAENTVIKLFPLGAGQTGAASHNFGTVPAGQERSIEVELTARQTGTVAVKVEVSCDGSARAEISEQVVVRRAALELEIAGARRQYVDTPVAYRIRVTNPGSAAAADLVLSAEIPEAIKFQSASDEGQLEADGRRVRWKIDVLRPGAEKIVELKGTLVRSGPAQLQVRCAADDLAAMATAMTDVDAMADLVMDVIDPPGPVAVGQEVTYEVRVQNRGSKAAEEIDLVAFFSQGIEPVSVEGAGHRISLGQVAFQKIPSLAPGGEFRAKIRAKAQAPGSHAFRTELQCRTQDARLASEKTTFFYGAESGPQVLARSTDKAAEKSGAERTADSRAAGGTTSR